MMFKFQKVMHIRSDLGRRKRRPGAHQTSQRWTRPPASDATDRRDATIGRRQRHTFIPIHRWIDCDRVLAFISPTDNTHFIVSTQFAAAAMNAFAVPLCERRLCERALN